MTATEAIENQVMEDGRIARLCETGYHLEAYDPARAEEVVETGINGESYQIGPREAEVPIMDEERFRRRVCEAQRRARRAVAAVGKATGHPHSLYICKHCADELLADEIAGHLRAVHGINR